MGAFFWTYAIFQVPSGWFAERLGTRIALSIFAVGWSVATLAVGVAPGFWLLIAAQLMMGVAQAGIFPAACNSIGHLDAAGGAFSGLWNPCCRNADRRDHSQWPHR